MNFSGARGYEPLDRESSLLRTHRVRITGVLLGGALLLAMFVALSSSGQIGLDDGLRTAGSGSSASSSAATSEDNRNGDVEDTERSLTIESENAYGSQPNSVLLGVYPHSFVLEPYRETTIQLSDTTEVQSVAWVLDGEAVDSDGFSFMTACTDVGSTRTITAHVTFVDDSATTTINVEATCIYVRRALVDLTDADRETFLDAMDIVYRIDAEEGRAQYGEDFQTIDYFVQLHLNGAGRQECDSWHDNAGILVHHSAFTLLFEQNLQRIDPSIAMAHWDYYRDGEEYSWSTMNSVPTLTYFGGFTPTDDGDSGFAISGGRFSNLPVRTASEDFDVTGPYGHLRSPWNIDPDTTVKRYHDILGYQFPLFSMGVCDQMQECYQSANLSHFTRCAADIVHGPVHVMIGGEKAPTDAFQAKVEQLLAEDSIDGVSLVEQHTMIFKRFWRHGFSRCATDCDASVDTVETCTCAVSTAMRARYTPKEMMESIGITDAFEAAGVDLSPSDASGQRLLQTILDVFGTPSLTGDMFTSAAPADPTFWIIHSPIEHVLHLIQSEVRTGEREFDSTWGYEKQGALTEDPKVCDWSAVDLSKPTSLPVCSEGVCAGHLETDALGMGNFQGLGETYTNQEYLDFISVQNTVRPFIFESLDLACGSTSATAE